MSHPSARYICSAMTVKKAQVYLNGLKDGSKNPGSRLEHILNSQGLVLNDLYAKDLIAALMNTRLPQMFAESGVVLDGTDWSIDENSILADIVLSTTGTSAYNNGAHRGQRDHNQPLEVHFLYTSGALLRNGHRNLTSDMREVIRQDQTLDEEAYYHLYERRLLPGLLAQNHAARIDGKPLVINIPGMGLGQFAGRYQQQLKAAFPKVLKRFFQEHADELDMVHTVNYDPYEGFPNNENPFAIPLQNTKIRLLARPLTGLPAGEQGEVASQLEFPKDGANYRGCRLVKVVAWDPFSYPGNDIWVNNADQGNGRETDDGVSFASSDTLRAMKNIGQFGEGFPEFFAYNSQQGIFYAQNEGLYVDYTSLANYPSKIMPDMIDFVVNDTVLELFKRINELKSHAKELLTHPNDALAQRKATILNDVAEQMQNRLDVFFTTPGEKRWGDLNLRANLILSREQEATLGEHRRPVLRWIKEFIALFATLFIGSIAITAYNAYKAEPGTFSLNKVGFFSETASTCKVDNVFEGLQDVVEDESLRDVNSYVF